MYLPYFRAVLITLISNPASRIKPGNFKYLKIPVKVPDK